MSSSLDALRAPLAPGDAPGGTGASKAFMMPGLGQRDAHMRFAATMVLALLISAPVPAVAEKWVRAGVANVGQMDEATIYVDTDYTSRHGQYTTYRARWVWNGPAIWNGKPFKESLAIQDVDCLKGTRFMIAVDFYDHAGKVVREMRWDPPEAANPRRFRGTPGHVAASFVCGHDLVS
jgi:hypothetical protein